MRLLLDTHVFLWVVTGSTRLSAAAVRSIEMADQIFVAAASLREIAIKARLGKIDADADELASAIEASGFAERPFQTRETATSRSPFALGGAATASSQPERP